MLNLCGWVMHRNTFINAPQLLQPTLQFKHRTVLAAGQLIGTEAIRQHLLVAGWLELQRGWLLKKSRCATGNDNDGVAV